MKKILVTLLTIACIVPTMSCASPNDKQDNDKRKLLVQAAESVQKQLPLSIGVIGDMTAFKVVGDNLVIEARVDETLINLDALHVSPELMHESMLSMMSNSSNPSMNMMLSLLEDAGMGMRLTYVGNNSGKRVTASLTNDDIKKSKTSAGKKDPDALLEDQIRITNIQLPMDYGNGLTGTKVVREGNYIVYYFECDESLISINQMEQNRSVMTATIQQQLSSHSPDYSIKELVRLCKDANVGIAYKYIGATSRKVMEVRIDADDME